MAYVIKGYSRETGKWCETVTTVDDQGKETPMIFDDKDAAKYWIDMFGQFIELDYKVEEMTA